MSSIAPAILTDSLEEYNRQIQAASQFCKRVQIDVSDSTFAPSTLIPLNQLNWPAGLQVDLHIMSAHPSDYLDTIVALKPSLCIIHAEVDDNTRSIFEKLQAAGIRTGVALLKNTYPGKAKELIASADHALIFAGDLGKQGASADMLQVEKVPLIRQIKPNIEIGWDGGANLSNVRALAHADIDVINVGSAISKASDPAAMYQSLINESEKKGVLI